MKLTVAERILLHLYKYRDDGEDPEARETYGGIAEALGEGRDYIAEHVCKLAKDGLVERRRTLAHGRTNRRLVGFSITRKGEESAEDVMREVEELHASVQRMKGGS